MIVNYTGKGWKVITQRAHGILAAQIAFHWKKSERPERWMETLLAIAEHDDAEAELEGENLVTSVGGPLNYDMKCFDKFHCEKLSRLTQTKNQFIALLTSLHMEFLYGKEAQTNPDADSFLKQQAELRKKWRYKLKITKGESLRIYDLLEWCDACSLLLCEEALQPEKREIEVSTGPDKKTYHLLKINQTTITVIPWPFETRKFKINFEWRLIEKLHFSSSAEFRKEFLKAPIRETTWTVRQQNTKKKVDKIKKQS